MGLFFVQRLIFLLCNKDKLSGISINEIILSGIEGIPMDLSMTSYILLPALILFIILFFRESKLIRRIIFVYFIAIIIVSIFIHVSDIGLFKSWGSKINDKAISYLAYPEDAAAATAAAPIFFLLAIFIIETVCAITIISRIKIRYKPNDISLLSKFILSAALLFLLFAGARGGLQEIPINKSWSYYSKYPVLNLAAVNSTWNALEVLVNPAEYKENPYKYFEDITAENICKSLHKVERDSTIGIFKTEKPNIILIMLESWSGDIIEALGGEKDVTPEFNKLCDKGMLFTNFYATGFRTEQGLAALLSGFPSQPKTTIIRKFGKFDKLPSLVNTLDSNGYKSAYYYGGDLEFANTLTYLLTAGFDKIIGEDDFDFNKRTEWGAYDEELFRFYLQDSKNNKEPFFHILITSTSHEPFNAPVDGGFTGDSYSDRYRNTISYTDKCLGNLIKTAQSEPWYTNTVFIITPDHGHFLPLNRRHFEAERHHIPFLILGGALKEEFKGMKYDRIGSHSDFAATLLSQLKLPHSYFKWSKDMFNKYQEEFAFYTFDEGFGWIDREQTLIFDHQLNDIIFILDRKLPYEDNNRKLEKGKAYLQVMMKEYIGLIKYKRL